MLPALLAPGGALAVSPLRALMRTQVTALPPGVAAAAYSNRSYAAGFELSLLDSFLLFAAEGVRLLFVAPEALWRHGALLRWACERRDGGRGVGLVAIDEAAEALPEPVGSARFRFDYGELHTRLPPDAPRMALTATAVVEERPALAAACGLR
eukprot:6095924-Prymnesium_polylepis.1